MKNALISFAVLATLLALVGCAPAPLPEGTLLDPALKSITSEDLLKHIRVLSSDEHEGRAPGTKGDQLTTTSLAEQFRSLGLKPGNPDGTYFQEVPLLGFKSTSSAYFTVAGHRN